jgi:uncharacterized repeat protein (TIGR02543 family)
MRRGISRLLVAFLAVGAFAAAVVSSAGPAGADITWGTPSEVAGSLNAGGDAVIMSVSCSSDGNCAAGGYYKDSSGNYQNFVVDEVAGVWGTASEVAGWLNAGGYYKDGSGNIQAFVFDEVYTVTFNANGGSGTMSAESYTSGVAKALTANAFTFTGYTFTGWNTAANGSGTAYTDRQIIAISGVISLYAQWIAKSLPKEFLKAHPSAALFDVQVAPHIHLFGKRGTVSGRVRVSFAGKTICSAVLVDGVAVCSVNSSRLGFGSHRLLAKYEASGFYRSRSNSIVERVR